MAEIDANGGGVLMRRVVVTGSECTGKTTLAEGLAAHFHTAWVPEFSREYARERNGVLTEADVAPIARGQMALEDRYAAGNPPLLILDTDLLSTVVYSRHYYGACLPWIEEECRRRLAPLYLLLHPDVPWLPDGIRDRGGLRAGMHELFRAALRQFGAAYADIAGDWETRKRLAIQAVERLLFENPQTVDD